MSTHILITLFVLFIYICGFYSGYQYLLKNNIEDENKDSY